jgi:enoyl-CoA hydratase/carnithine racemase
MSAVLTELQDGVLTVTLNRPERLNATKAELVQGLADACSQAVVERAGAVVITVECGGLLRRRRPERTRGRCAPATVTTAP